MALFRIVSVKGSPVKVYMDGVDVTPHIAADPRPVVTIAPAGQAGQSTVALTFLGSVDIEVQGNLGEEGDV